MTVRSSLQYALRVRDLVHGYVHLTKHEADVVNHRLFQRLRHVRQNDVAFFVYPSLNTSWFEHSLGCAHVAGQMAASIVGKSTWEPYSRATGISPDEFQRVCRLYALLHDVGHLPLSHLFELGLDDYVARRGDLTISKLCETWFGGTGFRKPHEACGSVLARTILAEAKVPESIASPVVKLLSTKSLDDADPLRPIKSIVDSEIDADRIDATARDGLQSGGEYGTYDIDRISSAAVLLPTKDGSGWGLAYSQKAVGSLEALLFDRYRTHTWIHFHHRVIAMKVAACEVITRLLLKGAITQEDFKVERLDQRDDIWLWALLRSDRPGDDEDGGAPLASWRAVVHRDNRGPGGSHVKTYGSARRRLVLWVAVADDGRRAAGPRAGDAGLADSAAIGGFA